MENDIIGNKCRKVDSGMGIADIISLLGGLAFFLFGMTLLGDGLKRVAGSKLEMILGRLTSTTLRGVLLGTLVTILLYARAHRQNFGLPEEE